MKPTLSQWLAGSSVAIALSIVSFASTPQKSQADRSQAPGFSQKSAEAKIKKMAKFRKASSTYKTDSGRLKSLTQSSSKTGPTEAQKKQLKRAAIIEMRDKLMSPAKAKKSIGSSSTTPDDKKKAEARTKVGKRTTPQPKNGEIQASAIQEVYVPEFFEYYYFNNMYDETVYSVQAPFDALSVSVDFSYIDFEYNWDKLRVYDADGYLCDEFTGLHYNVTTVNCPGNTAYIAVDSDGSNTGSFEMAGYYYTYEDFYNNAPVAVALADTYFLDEGGTVYFDGLDSYDIDGDGLTYQWDFDDGTYSDFSTAFKTFNSPGTYYVTLTVWDAFGAWSEETITITVYPYPWPEAVLTVDPLTAYTGDTISATAQGSSNVDYWEVDWGDGGPVSVSSNKNDWLSTSYSFSGQYYITATVVNSYGDVSTAFEYVDIYEPFPAPTISDYSPDGALPGEIVNIFGSELDTVTEVQIGGVPATIVYQSYDWIQAVVPNTVTGSIYVRNAGGYDETDTDFVLPPTIDGLSPYSAPEGSTFTIWGTGFWDILSVRLGSTDLNFTWKSTAELVATVPFGASSGYVEVTTGLGTAYSPFEFDVLPPTPTPAPVPQVDFATSTKARVGDVISLTGRNLAGATGVTFAKNGFGGSAAQILSATEGEVVIVVPRGISKKSWISVSNQYGSGQLPARFVRKGGKNPKAKGKFFPKSGFVGQTIVATGKYFYDVQSVTFKSKAGEVPAAFAVISNTEMQITVPAGAGPKSKIFVTNSVGKRSKLKGKFKLQ